MICEQTGRGTQPCNIPLLITFRHITLKSREKLMRNRNAYLNNSDYLDKKHGLLESFPNGPFLQKLQYY